MYKDLKKAVSKFDIDVEKVNTNDIHISVSSGILSIYVPKKLNEKIETLNSTVGKFSNDLATLEISLIGYPLKKKILKKFKGGTLLFFREITPEKYFSGVIFKKEKVIRRRNQLSIYSG